MLKNIFSDWKTTVGAIAGVLIFVAHYLELPVPVVENWGDLIGMILAGGSAAIAKDPNASSDN